MKLEREADPRWTRLYLWEWCKFRLFGVLAPLLLGVLCYLVATSLLPEHPVFFWLALLPSAAVALTLMVAAPKAMPLGEAFPSPALEAFCNEFSQKLGRKYGLAYAEYRGDKSKEAFIGVWNRRREDVLCMGERLRQEEVLTQPWLVPILAHEFGHLVRNPLLPLFFTAGLTFGAQLFVELSSLFLLFVDWRLTLLFFFTSQVYVVLKNLSRRSFETMADLLGARWTSPGRMANALEHYATTYLPKLTQEKRWKVFLWGAHPWYPKRVARIRSWKFSYDDAFAQWGEEEGSTFTVSTTITPPQLLWVPQARSVDGLRSQPLG